MSDIQDQDEQSKQQVNQYLAKVLAPAGHLHPIAGVIKPQEQMIFSGVRVTSDTVVKITKILYAISDEYEKTKTTEVKKVDVIKPVWDVKTKKMVDMKVKEEKTIVSSKVTREWLLVKKKEIDLVLAKASSEYVMFLNDFSVAVQGRGRREFTGVTIAQRSGITPQEPTTSWIKKVLGGGKKDQAITPPVK